MIRVLDIRVDEYDMAESVAFCRQCLAKPGPMQQVVTINPEGVWLSQDDPVLKKIIDEAALVTADGNGILWAAARLGSPLTQRVAGIELMEELCAMAAAEGLSVFLLGAKPGVAEAAAAELVRRYPSLLVAGYDNGYFKEREAQVIEAVNNSGAAILFAALGMPFQEKWLYQHADKLTCRLGIGVGGSFDVLSGNLRRAPRLWRRLKLEWLWRLLADPRRWRRYLVIPKYMAAVRRQATNSKRK